jgi:hypothetical protein
MARALPVREVTAMARFALVALSLCASCSSHTDSIVFVTRSEYGGDLKNFGGEATGQASADFLCKLEARSAELDGKFKAWLSSSTETAIDRIADASPWQTVGGDTVFATVDDLRVGPTGGITRDQFGDDIVQGLPVPIWTGTLPSGASSQYTCSDWTNASCSPRRADELATIPAGDPNTGSIGAGGATGGEWTQGNGCFATCPTTARLYCFEQR